MVDHHHGQELSRRATEQSDPSCQYLAKGERRSRRDPWVHGQHSNSRVAVGIAQHSSPATHHQHGQGRSRQPWMFGLGPSTCRPSVTHESTAGGQGGSFYVQCRHPARIAGGSRVKGSRSHRIQPSAIHKTSWSTQTTTAQRIAITTSLEARAWKISKNRHVTRPPE